MDKDKLDSETQEVEETEDETLEVEATDSTLKDNAKTPAVDAQKPEAVPYEVHQKKSKEAERLARVNNELKAQNLSIAERLSVFEQRDKELAEKDMSALEVLKNHFSELDQQHKKLIDSMKTERARYQVINAAKDLELAFKSPDRVLKIIGSDIEYDADGQPLNVRDLLEALAEDEPDLVKKAAPVVVPPPVQTEQVATTVQPKKAASVGSANNTNRDAVSRPQTKEQAEAYLKGKSAEEVVALMSDENSPLNSFLHRPARS